MIWLVFALLTLGALALMLVPMLRGKAEAAARAGYDLAVYRDQLKEVDADMERGLLTAAQADSARTEIKRRMLAAADAGEQSADRGGHKVLVAMVGIAVPAGALALYMLLGQPGQPDQPFAERAAPTASVPPEIAEMVGKLAQRLEQDPNNPQGWIMLARSYQMMERHADATDAYRRAIALGPQNAEVYSGFGEALMQANGGAVVPEAAQAFGQALAVDASNPRARFFLGVARIQQGDLTGGLAIWRDLEQGAPADAAWLPGLRDQIKAAAAGAGVDPATIPPKAPDVSAAAVPPSAADRQAMIQAMVERLEGKLAANPDDADGWRRLGRAYQVQGRTDEAKQAYGKAITLRPQDADLKLAYADLLLNSVPEDAPVPAEAVGVLREVLDLDADNPDALYFLGLSEAQAGRKAEAKTLWSRLLGQLPEGSPARQGLQQQLDALGG